MALYTAVSFLWPVHIAVTSHLVHGSWTFLVGLKQTRPSHSILYSQNVCDKKTGLCENANYCNIMDMHANNGYRILYGIMLLAKHP